MEFGINLVSSSNNVLIGNNITGHTVGIIFENSNENVISENYVAGSSGCGIFLGGSSNNTISGNTVANNWDEGISVPASSENSIYHNNFVNNLDQVRNYSSVNTWDDGYPSGGNYWSDYTGVDEFSGLNQDQLGSDGIGDTPYIINEDNQDTYPLMNPFGQYPPTPPVVSFTASATTVFTGEVVDFDASASYDPDGAIISYFWNFSDGNTGSGSLTTHSYAENGTYTVTLTVTDNDGLNGTHSQSVTVLNRSPVAVFTESAENVSTGEVIYFDASQSYDPDGSIISFFWDFGDGTDATGVTVDHAYADNGTYTVVLTVTDNDGATSSMYAVKNVLNRPPVAEFTESAETVLTGVTIHFDASPSHDQDGMIVNYYWDFGDGATTTGIAVDHAYVDDGSYNVTLTVKDDDGATAIAGSTKVVLNRSPVASFSENATVVYTSVIIRFDASTSYDLDGVIADYSWNFGDGTTASGVVVNHAYSDNGTYVVTLTVADDDGAQAYSSSTKTALNRAPVALFTKSAEIVSTGEVVTFNATSSYDPDGSITDYFWDFGDGASASGMIVNHVYLDDEVYTVLLVATDDDETSASTTSTVYVLNRYPVASFTESAETVSIDEPITFNASDSYDPDGAIVSYHWNFGDGADGQGAVVNHAYAVEGTYTVTLTVKDDDGATATATATKKVIRPPVASFSWAPSNPQAGESITFDGSASASDGGTIVKYEWDFGDGETATGEKTTHTYNDLGAYTVTLKVTDSEGLSATEQKQIILNLVLPSDLSVSSPDISFSDLNPSENQVVTISAIVHNIGGGNAEDVSVRFFDAETLIGQDQISAISFYSQGTASAEWQASGEGFHLIKVVVDPNNLISETDEENNEATRSILVGRFIGYGGIQVVGGIDPNETYPLSRLVVYGNATYDTHYGGGQPVAGAHVTVTIVGEEGVWETHSIDSGTYGIMIGAPISVGNYTVAVTVTDYTFWESLEYQLIVEEWPGGPVEGVDLAVSRRYIQFNPSNPVENDMVMVTAMVFNGGTIGADNVLVGFYEGNLVIYETRIDHIPSGENRSISVWWKASMAGWHTITVEADPYDEIVELNENNNIASKKIYVFPAWPDLTPTMLFFSDDTPVTNQLITISAAVNNIGGFDAENVLVVFYDNGTFISQQIISLIPGKGHSRIASFTHSFEAAGLHIITVAVDPSNNTIEAREDNNELHERIFVHLPSIDLTFVSWLYPGTDAIGFSNSTPTDGDVITISSRILNVGEFEANNVMVKFFDNETEIGMVQIASLAGGSSNLLSISWNATPVGLQRSRWS